MKSKIIKFREPKKRILIVNCFFDEMRFKVGRNTQIPQAMGPVYLAGAFSSDACEVRLYDEMSSGPLEDEKLLSWPDMLVLTGLNTAFDRMLHLTAYVRTKNEKAIVVAGGPAIRNLPNLSKPYFDYCCLGDIEELQLVIEDAFDKQHASEQIKPRYDLAYWMTQFGYVESSRYCNFKCSFCSLTGEGHGYKKYDLEFIRSQIINLGKRQDPIVFIDNNFYGNDRRFFLDRLELIKELRGDGYIKRWSALVTNDFFYSDENLALVKKAGCIALFSGLESFDCEWLQSVNKLQNTHIEQIEMVRRCIQSGVVFLYGTMLDVTRRRLADLRRELEFIIDHPGITLPSYISIIVPILGTPLFYEHLDAGSILPLTKLRDLESTTLCVKPLDPMDEVTSFIYDIQTLHGYKRKVMQHSWKFYQRYKSDLSKFQMLVALSNAAKLSFQITPSTTVLPRSFRPRNQRRTHLSTTEILDRVYQPAFPVKSCYRSYFRPTLLTDANGEITKELAPDIYCRRSAANHRSRVKEVCGV
jgi:radical SAM superfamily enzyme YgiQ (UPF0313 family)